MTIPLISEFINKLIEGAKVNLFWTAGLCILGFILIVLVIQGLDDRS